MQRIYVKLNPAFRCKKEYQQGEGPFHQQTGLKFKEETRKVIHLEHSFI